MNSLKRYRETILVSKAELARKAGISVMTIDRIEKGKVVAWKQKEKSVWHWVWNYLKGVKFLAVRLRLGGRCRETRNQPSFRLAPPLSGPCCSALP